METCGNCQRTIGDLEAHRAWQGHIVCTQCYRILARDADESLDDAGAAQRASPNARTTSDHSSIPLTDVSTASNTASLPPNHQYGNRAGQPASGHRRVPPINTSRISGHTSLADWALKFCVPGNPVVGNRGTHPWRRFFARILDVSGVGIVLWCVFGVCIAILFPVGSGGVFKAMENPIVAGGFAYLLWMPCEAVFLAVAGTTPAKSLFGIRVLASSGARLSFGSALKRTLLVWVQGQALGLPLVWIIPCSAANHRLQTTGTTLWDTSAGSIVTHSKWGSDRAIFCVVAVIVVLILKALLTAMGKSY